MKCARRVQLVWCYFCPLISCLLFAEAGTTQGKLTPIGIQKLYSINPYQQQITVQVRYQLYKVKVQMITQTFVFFCQWYLFPLFCIQNCDCSKENGSELLYREKYGCGYCLHIKEYILVKYRYFFKTNRLTSPQFAI